MNFPSFLSSLTDGSVVDTLDGSTSLVGGQLVEPAETEENLAFERRKSNSSKVTFYLHLSIRSKILVTSSPGDDFKTNPTEGTELDDEKNSMTKRIR